MQFAPSLGLHLRSLRFVGRAFFSTQTLGLLRSSPTTSCLGGPLGRANAALGASSPTAGWLAALSAGAGLPRFFSSILPPSAEAGLATFNQMGLGGWLLVDLALNWGGWAVAALLKTEKFYDLVGSLSFMTLTAGSLTLAGPITARKLLVSGMVGLWAGRLGAYLVHRVHKVGKDSRFDEVKHQPGMFLVYWTMQALWVFVTLLPVLIINIQPASVPLRLADAAGVSLWACGLTVEAVSDWQKDVWRANPENKGRFITTGLWSISRHPNYAGEIMLWWGMFFTCVGGFSNLTSLASVASPLFVMLLLRYVSGVPILEKQADARWGHEPEYQAYKARTGVLMPQLSSLLQAKDNQ